MPPRPALLLTLLPSLLLAAQAPLPLFPGRAYRPEPPRPRLEAGYTTHTALMEWLERLAATAPDRVRLSSLGRTEEGRPQPFLVISSPANLARLEELRTANARLADPRICTVADAEPLLARAPVFLWLAYTVHGSEAAGTEAAMAVAYHFAACEDPEVRDQLERVVLLLDPVQNPDGRERHVQYLAEVTQGTNPPDPQDAQNQGRWPGGRWNHRLFDLNRDWAWQTQAESRARAVAFLAWSPQLLADHHEMQPERAYFFPPYAQPIHEAIPTPFGGPWQTVFGRALARAFDAHGRAYFTRERFDAFYPSYGDTWASLQGAVGLTFENPNGGGLAYRRRDGEVLTLATRVRQHVLASLTTVATAAQHREALLRDFHQVRRARADLRAKAGALLVGPGTDPGRLRELAELLSRNGIESLCIDRTLDTAGLEWIGAGPEPQAIPEGSLLVPLDQPCAPLARALLEREGRMTERLSYDVTGWSLPLVFHLPAWHARVRPPVGTRRETSAPAFPDPPVWAYVLDPGQTGTHATLAALLQEGFRVWAAAEAFSQAGRHHPPGTLVLSLGANDPERLRTRLQDLARRHGHPVQGLTTGLADAGADPASPTALPLRLPRIAVLTDHPANPPALGAVLHTLRETGLPFTQLGSTRLPGADLAGYTHLVLADDATGGKAWSQMLGEGGATALKAWIHAGGTLVALRGGAAYAIRAGLSDVSLHFLAPREEEAWQKLQDPRRTSPEPPPEARTRPWSEHPRKELMEQIPGALLRTRTDPTHPLGWGLPPGEMAVLNTGDPILDLAKGGENVLHYPAGELRLSGGLPPDLRPRLNLTAYVLRERRHRGAVILFAGDPLYRGLASLTGRAFLNALFFGAPPQGGSDD